MNTIQDIHNGFLDCSGVSIDSRKIEPGNCFVAIKGPRFDGNQFAHSAIKNGARYAIVDDPSVVISDQYILVENGLITLQELAAYHRVQFQNLSVIVIAGSNGKTTTKELTSAVLSQSFNVLSTKGNLNNHIGVPLTLLEINDRHDLAIIEMGANHIGEHDRLCQLARPDYGLVTNCGKDHLAGYGSIDGVIQSNKEVYDYLLESNGRVFLPSDDETLLGMADGLECIYFGQNKTIENTLAITSLRGSDKLSLTIKSNENEVIEINSDLYGDYNAKNILAAVSIGHYFGIAMNKMKWAIESYKPQNNRSQRFLWNDTIVYLDAYNANPSSMKEFCKYIANFKNKDKIVILGAMEELGNQSVYEHQSLINQMSQIDYKELFLVGDQFKEVAMEVPGHYCKSFEEVTPLLTSILTPGSAIFVKGSRKYTLEKIFDL